MEDKLKILELKVKLYEEIDIAQGMLLYDLKQTAESALRLWHKNKDGKSTEDNNMFTFDKESLEKIESVLYKAKSEDLTDQYSQGYHRDYVKEIETKREIIKML